MCWQRSWCVRVAVEGWGVQAKGHPARHRSSLLSWGLRIHPAAGCEMRFNIGHELPGEASPSQGVPAAASCRHPPPLPPSRLCCSSHCGAALQCCLKSAHPSAPSLVRRSSCLSCHTVTCPAADGQGARPLPHRPAAQQAARLQGHAAHLQAVGAPGALPGVGMLWMLAWGCNAADAEVCQG